MTVQTTHPLALSAHTLIGDKVKNLKGEEIGTVEEIMIDIYTGRVAYAVLAFGGFMGVGNKLFAVPWSALTVDTTNEWFVLDADKEKLKHAPGFDKNDWPKLPSGQWYHQIYQYYQQEPYWAK